MDIISFNCPSCGGQLKDTDKSKLIRCSYCGSECKIVFTKEIDLNKYYSGDQESINNLENRILILKNALKAGNYEEAYKYSNKCLEFNPKIGELWEYKAICVYWLCVKSNDLAPLIEKLKEIKVLLNASKEHDPYSVTYNDMANAIGYNITQRAIAKYNELKKDEVKIVDNKKTLVYSKKSFDTMKVIFDIIEEAYDIMVTKDTTGLKFLVNEYSNKGKLIWWEPKSKLFDPKTLDDFKTNYNFGIDVRKKRFDLIVKITVIEKDYVPPSITYKKSYTKYYLIAVVVVIIIIALS